MGWPSVLLLALAVAMDATAVSAARGVLVPKVGARHVALVAIFFGGAQTVMPAIGLVIGRTFGPIVEAFDHWLAFGLLGVIGGKMIWEALRGRDEPIDAADPFDLKVMFLLAIATSIDALAVGATLPLLGVPPLHTIATIGLVTATLSALGVVFGGRLGARFGRRLGALGGVVLIGLGLKILLEHLGI